MLTDGVSYEAMLDNPRNEYKLYTLSDSRIIPVLRYVPLDLDGEVIGNPGKGFFRPIEYEVTIGEEGELEIVGPLCLNESQVMIQRYITKRGITKILHNLSQTTTVKVGTVL